MKRVRVANNVKLVGVKNREEGKGHWKIDYYIITQNEKYYAFTKKYTSQSYEMCKSGICLNDLMSKRTKDFGIMRLVDYTNFMMPYLVEYYDLPVAS